MNDEKNLCSCEQQEAVNKKGKAFDFLCEKLSGYAALAECVADAVEDVNFVMDNETDDKKSDKLVALVYLLNDGLQQLRDYIITVR